MTQLDLLDLIPVRQTQDEINANVVAALLGPHLLNWVIRSGKEQHSIRTYLSSAGGRTGGPGYSIKRTKTGVTVDRWFGAEPFALTYNQVFAVVHANTTPATAKALASACD